MPLFQEEYPEIASDRIILRRPSRKDREYLAVLFDHPLDESATMRMLSIFDQSWKEENEYILAIICAKDGKLKGIIELYEHQEDHVLIGYRIIPEERNQGYASEAVRVLVHDLIENEGIRTVYAAVQKYNGYSARLLKHNGFEQIEEKDGKLLFACDQKNC